MVHTYSKREMEKMARHGFFSMLKFHNDPYGKPEIEPYEVLHFRNTKVNAGGALMLDLLIGAGGQAFDSTHSYVGLGDDNSATTSGMTDLQGTLAATKAISSSTNASPIVLTMGAAHGYTAGDTITVAGHTVNTAANGTWVITVPSSTTIGLTGSTGNGVGGATGTTAKGNRFRSPMDATYPTRSGGQIMVWQSTFGSGQAEWGSGILEIALFNGFVAATSTMLARIPITGGVKTASSTQSFRFTQQIP